MGSSERASTPAAERRAAEQTHRLVTGHERTRQLVESMGRDDASAAQLAAMTPPPNSPEDIDAMRSTEQRTSEQRDANVAPANDLDEPANRPAESRWMSEGGALSDGPAQADGGRTPEDD